MPARSRGGHADGRALWNAGEARLMCCAELLGWLPELAIHSQLELWRLLSVPARSLPSSFHDTTPVLPVPTHLNFIPCSRCPSPAPAIASDILASAAASSAYLLCLSAGLLLVACTPSAWLAPQSHRPDLSPKTPLALRPRLYHCTRLALASHGLLLQHVRLVLR